VWASERRFDREARAIVRDCCCCCSCCCSGETMPGGLSTNNVDYDIGFISCFADNPCKTQLFADNLAKPM